MDLLRAEIERKKAAKEAAKRASRDVVVVATTAAASTSTAEDGNGSGSSNKTKRQYLKSSDLRRAQERQEEEEERKRRERGRNGANDGGSKKKRRREDDEGRPRSSSNGDAASKTDPASSSDARGQTKSSKAGDDGEDRLDNNSNISGGCGEVDGTSGGSSNDSKRLRSHTLEGTTKNRNREELSNLSPAEVTARLRSLGLPVRLFGERTVKLSQHRQKHKQQQQHGDADDSDGGGGEDTIKYDDARRIDRLHDALERRKVEMAGLSERDEFRLGSGHGIRNPFLEKGGEESSSAVTSAAAAAKGGDGGNKGRTDGGGNKARSDGGGKKKGTKNDDTDGNGDDKQEEEDPHKKIHKFFKSLLKQWEDELAHRPDAARHTAAGRNETKTFKQCKDYIRPLFKMCKSRRLEPAMMAHILNIVKYCEEGEFVKANDAYIDVAIGRAAWPIGVTMVGIHARSGREKIGSSNVAHVMNNELQRKYLTSVKRLISYCQKIRPDVDPSKKVVNK